MIERPNRWTSAVSFVRKVISGAFNVTILGLGWMVFLGLLAFIALAIVGLIYSVF